jgi:hypothetical protein
MAKGQQRSSKEKKKPKADKNQKKKHQPFAGKAPMESASSLSIGKK